MYWHVYVFTMHHTKLSFSFSVNHLYLSFPQMQPGCSFLWKLSADLSRAGMKVSYAINFFYNIPIVSSFLFSQKLH
jgi:hypothetical protein